MASCCGPLPEQWWRDKDTFLRVVAGHGDGLRETARAHGCSSGGLSKWASRHGWTPRPRAAGTGAVAADMAGVTVNGDAATVTTPPSRTVDLGDVETLLRDRGLDPDEWEVDRLTVNEWQAYTGRDDAGEPLIETLRQLKAFLRKKPDLSWVFPAVEVAEREAPQHGSTLPAERLVWLGGDDQAPYHDAELERAVLRWMADVQPDELVMLGDLLDFPTISRHADRPSWAATAQACIDAGYAILSRRRDVAPQAKATLLRGNHDWRLESELLTRAERMFGIKPAEVPGVEGVPALSLRRLLHLDALHIELVGVEGDKWELARAQVAPGLVAQHRLPKGVRVRSSVVAGDSHRQSIRQATEWDDGEPVTRVFVEAGCLCAPHGGLGYAQDPDWQQGFATVTVGAAGELAFELAYWRDGRLTWRGETWKGVK